MVQDAEVIEGKEVVMIAIADIVVGERFRKKFKNIDKLAESITTLGLLHPVIINERKDLVSGGRRIEAYKLLGKTEIPSITVNVKDKTSAEIDENNQRESFSVTERIAIADAIKLEIKANLGERRGKKSQSVENKEDVKDDEYPLLKEKTVDFVAKKAGFGNSFTYRQALTVVSCGIPEVIESMDDGILSINFAHKISQAPKRKQLSMLNMATQDPETNATALAEATKNRRKAKRKAKSQTPTNPQADPIYSIMLITPDWYNDLPSDILETPVWDYLNPDCGVVAIVCPNTMLGSALEAVRTWSLHYKATLTIYNKKGDTDQNLDYINRQSLHVVIAQADEVVNPGFQWVDPVFDRVTPFESVDAILAALFLPEDIKIDMTTTEKKPGWVSWKREYANSEEGDNDDTTDDTAAE